MALIFQELLKAGFSELVIEFVAERPSVSPVETVAPVKSLRLKVLLSS